MLGRQDLYFGDNNGETFRFDEDIHTDDDNAIAIKIRTKDYYINDLDTIETLERIYSFGSEPQGTSLSLSLDGDDYNVIDNIQEEGQKTDIFKKCRYFSLGLDEISSNNVKLKGFVIHYREEPEIV